MPNQPNQPPKTLPHNQVQQRSLDRLDRMVEQQTTRPDPRQAETIDKLDQQARLSTR